MLIYATPDKTERVRIWVLWFHTQAAAAANGKFRQFFSYGRPNSSEYSRRPPTDCEKRFSAERMALGLERNRRYPAQERRKRIGVSHWARKKERCM